MVYEERRGLSDTEKGELDRTLSLLRSLTYKGKAARANRPEITATYYIPCTDTHNDWYGKGGRYMTISGICWKVDDVYKTIALNNQKIPMDDIISIICKD